MPQQFSRLPPLGAIFLSPHCQKQEQSGGAQMRLVFGPKLVISWPTAGAVPGFQVGGGGAHLKKLRRAEGGAKIFGVFHVKNHHFTTCNPGSAPVKLPYILLLWMQEKLLTSFGTTVCLETRNMKPARPWMLAHLKIIWQFHAHPVNPNFWGISCEKSPFYAKKNHIFTGCTPPPSPESAPVLELRASGIRITYLISRVYLKWSPFKISNSSDFFHSVWENAQLVKELKRYTCKLIAFLQGV
jgi:hypothetical protein